MHMEAENIKFNNTISITRKLTDQNSDKSDFKQINHSVVH